MPVAELSQLVDKELEQNPLLETQDSAEQEEGSDSSPEPADEISGQDNLSPFDKTYADDDLYTERFKSCINNAATEQHYEALQSSASHSESLSEHLMAQLAIMDLSDEVKIISQHIIDNIGEDGLLKCPLGEVVAQISSEPAFSSAQPSELEGKVSLVLEQIIQKLTPPGVGARNMKECLLLQLTEDDPHYLTKFKLINNHIDDLMKNKIPNIAKELIKDNEFIADFGISPYSGYMDAIRIVEQMKDEMKKLSLCPGLEYSYNRTVRVIPEIIVKETAPGKYDVMLNDDTIPPCFINTRYHTLLGDKRLTTEQKKFLQKKLMDAKSLIEAINFRRFFLQQLAKYIVEYQHDFLEKGIEFLKPLKMKDMAAKFGMNISTISRAANEKYMQTPHGVFKLKFFFATAASKTSPAFMDEPNADRAKIAIMDRLNVIVGSEDKSRPLDDSEIADILQSEYNIKAARRTVAKYRMQLNIPPAKLRKTYK